MNGGFRKKEDKENNEYNSLKHCGEYNLELRKTSQDIEEEKSLEKEKERRERRERDTQLPIDRIKEKSKYHSQYEIYQNDKNIYNNNHNHNNKHNHTDHNNPNNIHTTNINPPYPYLSENEKYYSYSESDLFHTSKNTKALDTRKESYIISELIREDLSYHNKGLEEPLIESYHEIGEFDLKTLCELSLKLGCISFGGAQAHQDLIRYKFVKENKYLTDKHFNHILNLCLVLPGYSSSTLLAAIAAIKRKSVLGGLLALLLFNIPSLVAVLVFTLIIKTIKLEIHSEVSNYNPNVAYFSIENNNFYFALMIVSSGIIQAALGLMIHSAYTLGRKLSNSAFQFSLLLFAGVIYYLIPNYTLMVLIIILCGLASAFKGDHDYLLDHSDVFGFDYKISQVKYAGLPCLIIFFCVYIILYIADFLTNNLYFFLFESFYRIGTLSFSEGNVIIPMILTEYTNKNLLEEAEVLNGYALVSLLPGSMFNMAAFSGVMCLNVIGGIIANIAIFMPGFLFVFAALPFMNRIKSSNFIQFFIRGANSASIGMVFTAAVKLWIDSCFVNPYTNPIVGTLNVLICYVLVEAFKIHKPYVVIFGAMFMLILTYINAFFKVEGGN